MNYAFSETERKNHAAFAQKVKEAWKGLRGELSSGGESRQGTFGEFPRTHKVSALLSQSLASFVNLPQEAASITLQSLLPYVERAAEPAPRAMHFAALSLVNALLWAKQIRDRADETSFPADQLTAFLSGSQFLVSAFNESLHQRGPADTTTTATRRGNGWVLHGEKVAVTYGLPADAYLVPAVTDEKAAERALSLFLVPRKTPGVRLQPHEEAHSQGGNAACELHLRSTFVPHQLLIGTPGDGLSLLRRFREANQLSSAAVFCGAMQHLIHQAVRYCNEVKAGGVKLYKNEHFSFAIAELQVLFDVSRLLYQRAAWLCDSESNESAAAADSAMLYATRSARQCVDTATEIFRGSGNSASDTGHLAELIAQLRELSFESDHSGLYLDAIAEDVLIREGRKEPEPFHLRPNPARRRVMMKRVGICAVAQTDFVRDMWQQRFQGMALDVLESLLEQTGLDFSESGGIDASINVSDDVFDARTISDNAMTDVLGAHFRAEEKVSQEGIQAIYYGVATILSGHADVVLIIGHCKESQAADRRMVTHLAFDPFYTRPVGLDFLSAAALQAQAYLWHSSVTEQQLAELVVRARSRARRNPPTAGVEAVTPAAVMQSPLLCDPIRQLHAYPVSDGAVGLILASEERARELTDKPIWVTGVGNCFDRFFLGDRNLAESFALKKAASRALARAGLAGVPGQFDAVELSDQYAYQLPMWLENLGFINGSSAGDWLASNDLDEQGVNVSGGMLAGNPLILGGLVRVVEAVRQLREEAPYRDPHKYPLRTGRALAHGVMGPAGQFHSVVVLER